MPSGRKKGETNKYWNAEEKEKILLECKQKGIGGTKAAKEYGISRSQFFYWKRSMSRIATPTDNPIIESKNGWLKKEMFIDFNLNDYETIEEFINAVIYDHNYSRPSFALNYKTPIEYRTQLWFK